MMVGMMDVYLVELMVAIEVVLMAVLSALMMVVNLVA